MNSENKKLTSVKIDEDLWGDFKIESIRTKITFQKLAERAAFLFMTNPEFKKQITNLRSMDYTKRY